MKFQNDVSWFCLFSFTVLGITLLQFRTSLDFLPFIFLVLSFSNLCLKISYTFFTFYVTFSVCSTSWEISSTLSFKREVDIFPHILTTQSIFLISNFL